MIILFKIITTYVKQLRYIWSNHTCLNNFGIYYFCLIQIFFSIYLLWNICSGEPAQFYTWIFLQTHIMDFVLIMVWLILLVYLEVIWLWKMFRIIQNFVSMFKIFNWYIGLIHISWNTRLIDQYNNIQDWGVQKSSPGPDCLFVLLNYWNQLKK